MGAGMGAPPQKFCGRGGVKRRKFRRANKHVETAGTKTIMEIEVLQCAAAAGSNRGSIAISAPIPRPTRSDPPRDETSVMRSNFFICRNFETLLNDATADQSSMSQHYTFGAPVVPPV